MKKLALLILVLVCIGGIVAWRVWPHTVSVQKEVFTFGKADKGKMFEAISATGVLKVENTIVVSSDMPGRVQSINGLINQWVRPPHTLVQLDNRRLELKLEQAKKGVLSAQAALEQARALQKAAEEAYDDQKKKGDVGLRVNTTKAELELDAAKASVSAAEARVGLAKVAVREAQLAFDMADIAIPDNSAGSFATSSERGYLILDRNVKLGQMVGPQMESPLFILTDGLERMEVHAQVAEGDVGKIKKGMPAVFTMTAFDGEEIEFRGRVREIRYLPSNVKGAVYYDTVVEVDNRKDPETDEWYLRPGMTAAVDIIRAERKNVWRVPSTALSFQPEKPYQTADAQRRLSDWKKRPDFSEWRPIWVWDETTEAPSPILVRIGKDGKFGLKEGGYNEILGWEPGFEPKSGQVLQVITNAQSTGGQSLLSPSTFKVR